MDPKANLFQTPYNIEPHPQFMPTNPIKRIIINIKHDKTLNLIKLIKIKKGYVITINIPNQSLLISILWLTFSYTILSYISSY